VSRSKWTGIENHLQIVIRLCQDIDARGHSKDWLSENLVCPISEKAWKTKYHFVWIGARLVVDHIAENVRLKRWRHLSNGTVCQWSLMHSSTIYLHNKL